MTDRNSGFFTFAPQRRAPGVYFPPSPRQFVWSRVILAVALGTALGATVLVAAGVLHV